jgi:prephenate dehydrogenase
MLVGVVGGTGQMGSFFARVFELAGHEVRVSGRNTLVTSVDLAREADILIISVPIHSTIPVIQQITPFVHAGQILCDLTSLKSGPVHAMLMSQADVIGLHPMFGPTASSLQGQTIIATPARCSDEQLELLTAIFTSQGAEVTLTTPEYHDKMMAVIQGLTHFKALVMADTMRMLGITPEETDPFMSPIYRIETSVAGRILAQDPMLYADILIENPDVPHVLETCCDAAFSLAGIIKSGDIESFRLRFIAEREWFGDYCTRSQEETDRLISAMVKI